MNVSSQKLSEHGVDPAVAEDLARQINALLDPNDPGESWRKLTASLLTPAQPCEAHRYVHAVLFEHWDLATGPKPVWLPSPQVIEHANVTTLRKRLGLADLPAVQRWSVQNVEAFWQLVVEALGIKFDQQPQRMLADPAQVQSPTWLPGAQMNIVESCFSEAALRGAAPAIIVGTRSGELKRQSYDELRRLTNRVSNGLVEAGFKPGDAVAIDMPMTGESVAIYLGIIQAGCAAVSIADSLAAEQITMRLKLGAASGIFTTDHMWRGGKRLPMYEKVIEADAPRAIVLDGPDGNSVERRDGDVTWEAFLSDKDEFQAHYGPPDQVMNILFSSGTTGEPKAIPLDHTMPIKSAMDGHYHQDIHPEDVVVWPTSLGWMMGPWLIYASLINRATIALFEDVPMGRPFGQFVQDVKATMLGVVPSIVCQWRETGCIEGLDWSSVRTLSSTGECSNPDDYFYLMYLAGYRPVIEYCGGTEIGGGYVCSTVVQPNAPGTFSTASLGLDFLILDDDAQPTDSGEVWLVPPSIGLSTYLLNRDHDEVYFDGAPKGPQGQTLRRHGDHFQQLGGGYTRGQGRTDDTMNLGGIKVSSAEIERALGQVPDIRETAAIAVPPPGGGPDRLVVYAVTEPGSNITGEDLLQPMRQAVRQHLNPLYKITDVVVIDALPRTASQKVMRRSLRSRYTEQETAK
jgi:acetyl-CoA synthetase